VKKVARPLPKPIVEDTLPPLRLTATEVAHMLVAITDYDCDAREEFDPLIAKLGYHLALAYLYR